VTGWKWLNDGLRNNLKTQLDLTETQAKDMTFHENYDYSDVIFAQIFSGIKQKVTWTAELLQ